MEWRQQSTASCEEAYLEAQRWVEAVTKKKFGSNSFRSALENGVLLCDLINRIKPGLIRRVNRLSTPIAGLDNLNVFLKACGKLGFKEAQLFHPGDLQDLSTRVTVKRQETDRRLKNVLITIYWLGRRAHCEPLYDGPHLNLKAFEGLLGTALSKALEESSSQKGRSVRDSGFGDSWYSEREEFFQLRGEGGGGGHRREDSLDSLDSLGSRPHSISSDATLKGSSEGCCSDAEAESAFRMAENKDSLIYRRSLVVVPKTTTQFNQFLPTKDKSSGYVPAPLRKKRAERHEDNRRSWASPMYTEEDGTFTSETALSSDTCDSQPASQSPLHTAQPQWTHEYDSGSDSDADRPDPDLVLDDLASRRFHSPSPAPPTNFALPICPLTGGGGGGGSGGRRDPWPKVTMIPNVQLRQSLPCLSINSQAPQSPQQGSVKVDLRRPMSADSLLRELYDDSEDEDDEEGYADPVQDDLYARKVGLTTPPAGSVPYDKFLPKFWTPEEEIHVQKIKLGSQRRPWYKKMQGFSHKKSGSSSDDSDSDITPWLSYAPSPYRPSPSPSQTPDASAHATRVVGKRTAQKHDGSDGSKSMNDIQVDPTVVRQVRYEELQKYRDKVKESEDKWQDDLTKWKNRRRSVNLDIVKKKEEREQIEQITYGGGGGGGGGGQRRSKTFKEMQEQRESRGSVGSRLGSLSYLDEDEDVFDHPVSSPRSRTLPARSYTIDSPYSQTDHWVSSLREEDSPAPPPQEVDRPVRRDTAITNPDTGTTTTTAATARHSTIHNPDLLSKAPPMEKITSPAKMESSAATSVSTTSYLPKATEPCRPTVGTHADEKPPSSGSLYKRQPQYNSTESKPPTASRVSASLPRSYQRSDCARLTSVIAPRPFGTQSTRVASLPRAVTMDDPHKRVNGDVDVSKKSSVPSRYHQFMTSEDEARSHSSSAHSSEDEEEDEEMEGKNISAPPLPVQSISPVAPQVKSDEPVSPVPTKDAKQESYCDMRISLNQKPNSSRDFGFQADWDSTGAHVTSVQSGSPAEMCQLQVGDEVLTVSGHKVAHMSYPEWKACMEDALQQGSLVIDIRRHGKNNWDRNLTSLPFKSHKTINLTSTDHPIPLGASDANTVNPSLDFTSRTSTETLATREAPTHPIIDVASNGLNGGFREQPVTMRNKESEPIALKNLKRRSEFFEQGGSDSALSDVPVPSITPSSSRWSWDPEEERRRQEKWQKEQERLLQEKYKRDQEKLEEEWRKAQQEIASIAHQQQEPMSLRASIHSISPHSPLSPLSQPTSPWEDQAEEEERRRREEQERQRQAEEKRKREEEEKELQRLQKERKMREEEELRRQRRRQEEKREEEERRHQEEAEWQRREQERVQEPTPWGGVSYGFSHVHPEITFTDRAKSKSTPQLDEAEKPEGKGTYRPIRKTLLEEKMKHEYNRNAQSLRAVSELEMERRNILNAMRYREPERVTGSVAGEVSWRDSQKKSQQSVSQAEVERQQILQEMKKKTHLLTDSSWIRQSAAATITNKEPIILPMRRGESLDNLTGLRNSWRSSWTPGSTSSIPNYSRPHSALSGSTSSYGGGVTFGARSGSATLPSSYSMGSVRGGAGTPSSPWSQQSPSLSPTYPSPTTSPEPASETRLPQQRSRSVSGKKICTFCDNPLGKGAAMIIESLGLCYHLACFKCIDCKSDLGGSETGAEVRIRNKQLYCNSCYMRFKMGQPTAM